MLHLWLTSTTEKTHLNWLNLWDLLEYTAMTLNKDCPEGSKLKYNNIKSPAKRLKSRKAGCPDAGAGAFKLRPAAACWGGKMQNSWADLEKAAALKDTVEDGMMEWPHCHRGDCWAWIPNQWPVILQTWALTGITTSHKHTLFTRTFGKNHQNFGPCGRTHTHKTVQASALYDLYPYQPVPASFP